MNIIFHQQKAGLFGEIEKYKKTRKENTKRTRVLLCQKPRKHPKINQSSVKKDMNQLKEGFTMAKFGTT